MAVENAIGIDLGGTYSSVAVYKDSGVHIIPNKEGKRNTPSIIAFVGDSDHPLVGEAARTQWVQRGWNVIFNANRLLGRKFHDPALHPDLDRWPFKVISSGSPPDDKPLVEVEIRGQKKTFKPEEICGMILSQMKEAAQGYLNGPVTHAVITVPAYFTDAQREATTNAARLAGLEVLRLVNEPTAAAIAFRSERQPDREEDHSNMLIFDLGGRTLNVSLVTVEDGFFEIIATASDTQLGGDDFDNRLLNYCVKEFTKKNQTDLHNNLRALGRLRIECERAKRTLSTATQASVRIDVGDIAGDLTITRQCFEDLNADYFRKCMEPVAQVLKNAATTKENVHDVILVGGSSCIPKIQQLLQDTFGIAKVSSPVHPDEAVASGAALAAAIISNAANQKLTDALLLKIAPSSLGLEAIATNFPEH